MIRVQAALVLALSQSDPKAWAVLKKSYEKVNRDIKINILNAMGYAKEETTIPFLIDQLSQPFFMIPAREAQTLLHAI